jgi:Transposase DDE domain
LRRHWFEPNGEALKRRGSLSIWFDPDMAWAAKPTGKRGCQPVYSDAAVQTCLAMKVPFGMAQRQTTGFVESLLRRVGLDWDVPDFSTLSRRQKTLAVNIPHRGSQGPSHLLIDIEPVSATGSREPARVLRELLDQILPDQETPVSLPTAPLTRANAMAPSPPVALPRSSRRARTPSRGSPTVPVQPHATRPCAHHGASVEPSGDDGAAITAGAASKPKCIV